MRTVEETVSSESTDFAGTSSQAIGVYCLLVFGAAIVVEIAAVKLQGLRLRRIQYSSWSLQCGGTAVVCSY